MYGWIRGNKTLNSRFSKEGQRHFREKNLMSSGEIEKSKLEKKMTGVMNGLQNRLLLLNRKPLWCLCNSDVHPKSILHQSQLGKQENVNQIKWNAEKCPIFVQTWSSSSMLMNLLPFKTLSMNSKRNILLRTDTSKKLTKAFCCACTN